VSVGGNCAGAQVTVVIRVRNRAQSVGRAIRCALGQNLADQPILVVDDASTDATREAVTGFGPRVRLVARDTHGGPGAAANTGLQAVTTPYVAFLDSDDTWDTGYLAAMLAALRAAPRAVLAYSGYRLVYEAAGVEVPVEAPAAPADALAAVRGFRVPMSATVGCVAAWRAIGGFRTGLMNGEDKDLQVRLAARDPAGLLRVPECRVGYHLRDDGVTADFERYLVESLKLLDSHLRAPAFAGLSAEAGRLRARRAIAIAQRRRLVRALASPADQDASLIVIADGDPAALESSLRSAAAQRRPPVDALVAAPPGAPLSQVLDASWPFRIERLPAPGGFDWPTLRRAVARARGDLVGFLHAGDGWHPGELDGHRRALKAYIDRVAFSYAQLDGQLAPGARAEAAILPACPKARAVAMTRDEVPGSLSAMAADRKLVVDLSKRVELDDAPLWLALAKGLTQATAGPAVRVRLQGYMIAATPAVRSHTAMPEPPEIG
jgi:glycosyltransferase involved in cell wall biosynthesis